MKIGNYRKVIGKTPFFVPVFIIKRCPDWLLLHGFKNGDWVALYKGHVKMTACHDGTYRLVGGSYEIPVSALEAVGYSRIKSRLLTTAELYPPIVEI
jgi:hypothetical protein